MIHMILTLFFSSANSRWQCGDDAKGAERISHNPNQCSKREGLFSRVKGWVAQPPHTPGCRVGSPPTPTFPPCSSHPCAAALCLFSSTLLILSALRGGQRALNAIYSSCICAREACFHNRVISFVQPTGKSDTVAGILVLGHIKTICNKSLFAVTFEFGFQLLLHLSSVFILINFHSFFYSGSFFFFSFSF